MPSLVRRLLPLAACCGLALTLSGAAVAQTFTAVDLVSNLPGKAAHLDPLLANPWGLAYGPGGPFWISDEASGWSTLYDANGTKVPLNVLIPTAGGDGPGTPTGIVFNGSPEFKIRGFAAIFLFAT